MRSLNITKKTHNGLIFALYFQDNSSVIPGVVSVSREQILALADRFMRFLFFIWLKNNGENAKEYLVWKNKIQNHLSWAERIPLRGQMC